jgi:CHAT domain-containing protein
MNHALRRLLALAGLFTEMVRRGVAARLVVLWASDTAGGDPLEGKGIIEFSCALMASGTGCTLLTLWPVGETATARLMPSVLAGVRAGQRPSLALARAKRELIARKGAADPRAWSEPGAVRSPVARPPPGTRTIGRRRCARWAN